MGPGSQRFRPGERIDPGNPDLRHGRRAGRNQARVSSSDPLYAAQQEQLDRLDGGPLRRSAPGRVGGAPTYQAAVDPRSDERLRVYQPGPEHLEGSDSVEPAGVARLAGADSGAAGGQYVALRGPDLHSGHGG